MVIVVVGLLAAAAINPNPAPDAMVEMQRNAAQAARMANLMGPLLRQLTDSTPKTLPVTKPVAPLGEWKEYTHKGLEMPRVEESAPTTPTVPAPRLYDAPAPKPAAKVEATPTPAPASQAVSKVQSPAPAAPVQVTVSGGNATASAQAVATASGDACCELRVENAQLRVEHIWMARALTAERELAVRKEFEVKRAQEDSALTSAVLKLAEGLLKSPEVSEPAPAVPTPAPAPVTSSVPATKPVTKAETPTIEVEVLPGCWVPAPPIPTAPTASTKALVEGLVHDADNAEAERDDALARLGAAMDRIKLLEEELRSLTKGGGKKGKAAKRLKY